MSYDIYPRTYVAGVKTVMVYYDSDFDYDLNGVTSATVMYKDDSGETQWDTGKDIVYIYNKKEPPDRMVVGLIIPITPTAVRPGCLGRLLAILGIKGHRFTSGSGTVSGSLNKGDLKGATGGSPIKLEPPKDVTLVIPLIA